MKFVDYVTITIRSGNGGKGSVSFRREKYNPHGGPDGGNGGKGASILMEGDAHLYTLLDLRYNRHHFGDHGGAGGSNHKSGKDGEDIIIRVPIGTIARDQDTGELLGEIEEEGEQLIIAEGGRGGKGNSFFKSSTRQTPRFAQPGEEGQERNVALELRLLADVGLVGYPNAGKSTLVSSLSAARPKVANYPFTTLTPSLGVVRVGDYQSFVMADIPGLIEGAHEGKGLGIQFLKHIEKNAILLFVVPVTDESPASSYEVLLNELALYNEHLLKKPRLIALSKTDLIGSDDEVRKIVDEMKGRLPEMLDILPISSVAQKGLDRLRLELWKRLESKRKEVE